MITSRLYRRVSRGVLLILLALLQFPLWFSHGNWREVWSLRARCVENRKIVQQKERQNASVLADIRDAERGVEALEERAREELGLMGPGERYYNVYFKNTSLLATVPTSGP